MTTFEIWCEGFMVMEGHGKASLLGTYEAETWDEAVQKYMKDNPGRITVDSRGYTDWGCRLFDNKLDAQRSFG